MVYVSEQIQELVVVREIGLAIFAISPVSMVPIMVMGADVCVTLALEVKAVTSFALLMDSV